MGIIRGHIMGSRNGSCKYCGRIKSINPPRPCYCLKSRRVKKIDYILNGEVTEKS